MPSRNRASVGGASALKLTTLCQTVEAGEERGREHQARDVRGAARRMERDRPPEDAAEDRDHERQRQRQRDAHEALEREEQHRPGEEDETEGYDLHRDSRPPRAVAVED